jgi:rRNA-processing protein FCF1
MVFFCPKFSKNAFVRVNPVVYKGLENLSPNKKPTLREQGRFKFMQREQNEAPCWEKTNFQQEAILHAAKRNESFIPPYGNDKISSLASCSVLFL